MAPPDALSTATTPSVWRLLDFGKLLVDVCLLSCPVLLLLLDQLLVLGGLDYVWRLQHKTISHSVTDAHEVLMKGNIRQNWAAPIARYVTELCMNMYSQSTQSCFVEFRIFLVRRNN